jgi:integrase
MNAGILVRLLALANREFSMGSIRKLKDRLNGKKRKLSWRLDIHHREPGWTFSKCYATEEEAILEEARYELAYRMRNNPEHQSLVRQKELENLTVRDLIEDRIRDLKEEKGIGDNEGEWSTALYLLGGFLSRDHDLVNKNLSGLSREDGEDYRDYRLKYVYSKENWETASARQISGATVVRELGVLRKAFKEMSKKNKFKGVVNPFEEIEVENSLHKDSRKLEDGEHCRLLKWFEDDARSMNRRYGPLAISLSLDTSLRLQEIVGLKWSEVLFDKRRIYIRKTKTDWQRQKRGNRPGFWTVLPVDSMSELIRLACEVTKGEPKKVIGLNAYIFDNGEGGHLTSGAMSDTFKRAVKGLGLPEINEERLTFRCLRRNANINFSEAGLLDFQRDLMRGGMAQESKMDKTYGGEILRENDLKVIQDKLDEHVLRRELTDDKGSVVMEYGKPVTVGMTLEQAVYHYNGRHISNLEMLRMGEIPIPDYHTRMEKAEKAKRRLLMEEGKVYVIRMASWDGTYRLQPLAKPEAIGYMSMFEAFQLTKCSPIDLQYIDSEGTKGALSANGYLFFSDAWIKENLDGNPSGEAFTSFVVELSDELSKCESDIEKLFSIEKLDTHDWSIAADIFLDLDNSNNSEQKSA